MITKKLYSPFLFAFLGIGLFLVGCTPKKHNPNQKTVEAISRQLEAATDESLSPEKKLDSATKAFDASVKLDSAFLVWSAFTVKYPLLQSYFSEQANSFLQFYTKLSRQKRDTVNLANAYLVMGKRFAENDKPDSAYFYYNASRILCEARKDSLATVEKITNMAYMHYTYNDFAEFENTTTEGLKFLPKIPKTKLDSVYLAFAYNNYGLAYTNMFEPKNAIKYYLKAYDFNPDITFKNAVTNNLALVYMSTQEYKKAISLLSGILTTKSLQTDPVLYSKVMDNLGYSFFKEGDSRAYAYLGHAFDLRKNNNDVFGTVASLIHLAEYYKTTDYKRFTSYAYEAYQKATLLHSANDRLEALRLLSEKRVPESRKFSDLYIHIKDSVEEARQKTRNQFAKIKYDSETANEENRILRTETQLRALQIERSLWINIGLGLMVIVIIIITRLLFLLYRKRYKKEKIKEAYDTEQRISKKVHDELANDVFNAITFTQTQDLSDLSKKEALLTNLDSIYDRTRDISRENSPIDTGINFPLQLRQLFAEYQNNDIKIMIRGLDAMPWEIMEADKKQTVYRVLQELMVNMKKHSLAKNVVLQFEMEGKKVKISYSDNGVGMDTSAIFLKNGLQNVENRIHAIGGCIIFESEPGKGLQLTLSYPPENSNYV